MPTEDLVRVAEQHPEIDAKPESERHELQLELCDRLGMTFVAPDGSKYEPSEDDGPKP